MRGRSSLLALALAAVPALAFAQYNPGVTVSGTLIPGGCVQATGQTSIGTPNGNNCNTGTGGGAGNVVGPTSSTINDVAAFSNSTGTGILDTGVPWQDLVTTGAAASTYLPFIGGALTGPVTVSNGASVPGALASVAVQNSANTAAVRLMPDLAAGNYDPLAEPGDGAIIDGTGDGDNFGLVIGLWSSTTPTGLRISASGVSFPQRPVFNGATPWDSANFNPAGYLPLAGGQLTGTLNGTSINLSGSLLAAGATLNNGSNGSSSTSNFTVTDGNASNAVNLYPNLPGAAYNSIVQSGDAAVIGGASAGAGNLDLTAWSSSGTATGIRITPTGNFVDGTTTFNAATTFSGSSTWGNNTSITAPQVILGGTTTTAPVEGIYTPSGSPILYTLSGNTYVAGPSGGGLTLSGTTGGGGITVASNGNATATQNFTVEGGTLLQGATVAAPAASDNSTAVPSTAWVNAAIAAGSTGGSPVYQNLTVTNQFKVTGYAQFAAPIQIPAITPVGSAPSSSVGTGAGTGGTATTAGTALNGQFSVSTGTNPAAGGVLVTLTFSNVAYAAAPFCVVSAASQNTAEIYSSPNLNGTTLTLTLGLANNEQLAPDASYSWNWVCP
jgi:hypothetical protein